jgi:hypothetical protein
VDAMLASLTVRRVDQSAPTTPGVAPAAPRPTVALADLAGEWGRHDGINTRYVDRQTGSYAGTDSIHFTEKWVIAADGTISLDFFGIHNGRRIIEKSTGVVTLSAGILGISISNPQRYVLRGWSEAPDMTVMTLNGPWYADPIPPEILTNPAQGANLDQQWVRLRR